MEVIKTVLINDYKVVVSATSITFTAKDGDELVHLPITEAKELIQYLDGELFKPLGRQNLVPVPDKYVGKSDPTNVPRFDNNKVDTAPRLTPEELANRKSNLKDKIESGQIKIGMADGNASSSGRIAQETAIDLAKELASAGVVQTVSKFP